MSLHVARTYGQRRWWVVDHTGRALAGPFERCWEAVAAMAELLPVEGLL